MHINFIWAKLCSQMRNYCAKNLLVACWSQSKTTTWNGSYSLIKPLSMCLGMLTAFMFRYGVLKPHVICEDVHDSPKLSTRGGHKNNENYYFFKWFIRFCTITNLISFKVLSFWLHTLVPTFFPLLKTFLELFSADVVQDLQSFLFHFADIRKRFPFIWPFIRGNRKKSHGARSGE